MPTGIETICEHEMSDSFRVPLIRWIHAASAASVWDVERRRGAVRADGFNGIHLTLSTSFSFIRGVDTQWNELLL